MQTNRLLAASAYFLPVLSWVLIAGSKDSFARYHMKQAMMIWFVAVLAPVIWLIFAWLITWLPLYGAVIAAATFSLVMVVALFLVYALITGISRALRQQQKPIAFIGRRAENLGA